MGVGENMRKFYVFQGKLGAPRQSHDSLKQFQLFVAIETHRVAQCRTAICRGIENGSKSLWKRKVLGGLQCHISAGLRSWGNGSQVEFFWFAVVVVVEFVMGVDENMPRTLWFPWQIGGPETGPREFERI